MTIIYLQTIFGPLIPVILAFFQGILQFVLNCMKAAWFDVIIIFLIELILLELIMLLINGGHILLWRMSGKVGPIRVETDKKNPEVALLMGQYLTECGAKISDTNAPNISPGFETISTALTATDRPEGKVVAALLIILGPILSIKKVGYTVSCSFTGDVRKPPVDLSITIKLMRNGQILRLHSLSGDSKEDAVRRAAYWVYWYISGRKYSVRNIPIWYRFTDFEGFLFYRLARRQSESDFRKADEMYQKAAADAPFNALVHLFWGDINETNNQYVKALEVYLSASLMWPFLYVFWYRIAFIFSSPDEWFSQQWRYLENKKKNHLKELILRLCVEYHLPNPPSKFNKQEFYQLASNIWDHLEKEIRFGFMLKKWVSQVFEDVRSIFCGSSVHTPKLAHYYWKLIPWFAAQDGQQFRRSIQLAKLCTRVQKMMVKNPSIRIEDLAADEKEVEKIVKMHCNKMDIYYSAACYYALLSQKDWNYLPNALEYLKKASKDPHEPPDVKWIQNDPDFKFIKNDPEFRALFMASKEVSNKSIEENERKAKLYVLELVQEGSQQQKKDWESIFQRAYPPEALIVEAEYQISLWESLINVLNDPQNELLHELFWQRVMQKTAVSRIPTHITHHKNATLEKVNVAWENIIDHAQPQLDTWGKHRKDSELFFKQKGGLDLNNILEMWKQSEMWQWDYFSRQIEQLS